MCLIGCPPGTCKIELDQNVKPVQHQHRTVPVAQHAKFRAEIERHITKTSLPKLLNLQTE